MRYHDLTEDDLHLDPIAGRERWLEPLVERYERPLYQFFKNRGFSHEESQDLSQDTFLGAYRSMQGHLHIGSVKNWLFSIAKNICNQELRRRSAQKREVTLIPLDAPGDRLTQERTNIFDILISRNEPLGDLMNQERRLILRYALDQLPAKMRRCLILRIGADLKYREIACLLRISIGTVKSHISQAKNQLAKILGKVSR